MVRQVMKWDIHTDPTEACVKWTESAINGNWAELRTLALNVNIGKDTGYGDRLRSMLRPFGPE